MGADLGLMDKISSHHMMRSMIVLIQWGYKRIYLEAFMHTVFLPPILL